MPDGKTVLTHAMESGLIADLQGFAASEGLGLLRLLSYLFCNLDEDTLALIQLTEERRSALEELAE